MIIFLLFILLIISQSIFIFKININKKYFIFLLTNPILYLFYPYILIRIRMIKIRLQNKMERKKHAKEITKIIEQFIFYIKSGIQPSQALQIISQKKKWTLSIKNSLSQITTYYSQGMSFESSINIVISSISNNKYNHFLLFFLFSLKLGYSSGGNIISILEKVRIKIENSILIEQKIKATTAQIRLQAIIISFSPLVLGVIIWFLSPSYIIFFFDNGVGNFLFVVMLLLNIIGFYLLKRISRLT